MATVVTDETPVPSAAAVSVANLGHRFSWNAIVAGALVATAVTLFLLALGSGLGLVLITPHRTGANSTVTFLTLGAIYFFASQTFGFAAGGHLAGRLMGPVLENPKEEEFLAGSHGLVMWALAVFATALLVYFGALSGASAALGGVLTQKDSGQPVATAYWVDRLFRPRPEPTHASLAWRKFAQVDTGTANDASPSDQQNQTEAAPVDTESASRPAPEARTSPQPAPAVAQPSSLQPTDFAVPPQPAARNIAADKAEASHIVEVAMANGGQFNDVDRAQLAQLVSLDTGLPQDAAENRVQMVESQLHVDETRTLDTARKTAAYASLWTALALLFGAVVATMASVSARWEDDRVTFGFLGR